MAANWPAGDADYPTVPGAALPRGSGSQDPVTGRAGRARRRWRDWRRSRPFWGGLLVVAGGAEIIATTLVSLGVTLRVGLGGVGGLLGTIIALVLVLCGVLLWLSPAQRAFYSIVAVVLALATFNTINLGGFLIGMLLGITGGALGFAWTPGQPARGGQAPGGQAGRGPGPGGRLAGQLRTWWRSRGQPAAGTGHGWQPARWLPGHWSGGREPRRNSHRLPAVAALPLGLSIVLAGAGTWFGHAALAGSMAPGAPGVTAVAGEPAAGGDPGCLIIILCPSPSPSPHPSPHPSQTATPSPSPSATGTPPPGHHGHQPKGHRHRGHVKRTAPTHGLAVATAASTLTAGSARIVGLSYDGVAKVPRRTGGPLRMMKFGIQSVTLTGRPTLTITERGSTAVTTTSALSFTGHVVLYATKLSGDLLGVPLTLTPDSPESLVLRLLKPFSQHLTVTMTNVVTGHPLTLADSSQWTGFTIRVH